MRPIVLPLRPPSVVWDVFLNNRHIDTVWFDADMTAEDVKRSLVNHDAYDSRIKVRRG